MRDLIGVVRDASTVFSSLRIRYVIVGGVVSNLLGRARSTFDVDAIAALRPEDAPRLARRFGVRGFDVSAEDVEDALRERGHFSVFDRMSEYRIDCKGAYTRMERRALEDRQRFRIGRTYSYIDAPENLVVIKLLFGSEQDLLDAEAVCVRQWHRLDLRRTTFRAQEAGVQKEWAALKARVEDLLRASR
jgi:hypothetical protein